MIKFYAPKSLPSTVENWRHDHYVRAAAAIACRGGVISGEELASILGVSPRALRQLLIRDKKFQVEYREPTKRNGKKSEKEKRGKQGRRGQPWYRLSPESIEPPPVLPPLIRPALTGPREAKRLTTNHLSSAERFMDHGPVKK